MVVAGRRGGALVLVPVPDQAVVACRLRRGVCHRPGSHDAVGGECAGGPVGTTRAGGGLVSRCAAIHSAGAGRGHGPVATRSRRLCGAEPGQPPADGSGSGLVAPTRGSNPGPGGRTTARRRSRAGGIDGGICADAWRAIRCPSAGGRFRRYLGECTSQRKAGAVAAQAHRAGDIGNAHATRTGRVRKRRLRRLPACGRCPQAALALALGTGAAHCWAGKDRGCAARMVGFRLLPLAREASSATGAMGVQHSRWAFNTFAQKKAASSRGSKLL